LQLQREATDKTRERTEEELKNGRKPAA
jgi:hypothetical protein